jgi:type IV pilus assembly protein PilM
MQSPVRECRAGLCPLNLMMKSITKFFQSIQVKGPKKGQPSEDDFASALDLGRTRLLFLQGGVRAGKIFLNRLEYIPITADFSLTASLKVLFDEKKCNNENIRFSLKSPQVVTRFLRFPKMSEKELRGVLQYEIEQYVPYDSKDLYLDLAILQESIKTDQGESTEVFVAVAKKDHLDSVIKQFQEVQATVDAVDVDILACMKCLKFFHPEEFAGHVAILDLGVHVTTLGVIRGAQPRFIRDLSFGSQDIAKKLKNRANLGDTDIQNFLDGKTIVSESQVGIFSDSIEGLINDVKVSFDYYRDQSEDGVGADCLFVCGLGAAQQYILQALEKALDIPVKNMDLASKIELNSEIKSEVLTQVLADSPVALGLLLRDYD